MSSKRKTDIHPAAARLTALAETAEQTNQEPRGPAKVIQLPLWPEAKRGAPNAVLRAALFAAIQGKGRQYINRSRKRRSPRNWRNSRKTIETVSYLVPHCRSFGQFF